MNGSWGPKGVNSPQMLDEAHLGPRYGRMTTMEPNVNPKITKVAPLLVTLLFGGCTHIDYQRQTLQIDAQDVDFPYRSHKSYTMDLQAHELKLMDATGIFCSSLITTTGAAASYKSAEREAIEDNKRSFEYEYRVHSPSEYAGVHCGAYARWGQGTGSQTVQPDVGVVEDPSQWGPEDVYSTPPISMGEGGLYIRGADLISQKVPWLRWSIDWRLGMGRWRFDFDAVEDQDLGADYWQKLHEEEFYFRSPFDLGLLVYPSWLFGLGGKAYVGFDPIGAALTADLGRGRDKIDYGAQVAYVFTHKAFAVSIFGEFHRRNYVWGEHWTQEDGVGIGASFALDHKAL